jgi:sialate O-acetylesterase
LQALSEVYGIAEISETMPPIFREFYRKDDDIILMFDNPSDFDLKGDLKDFEISYGEEYFPAEARIDGDCIILSAEHDREVKSVRYLWTNYTNITLYSANGLPVPPFKT